MTKAPGRKLHAIVFATLVTSLLIASSPGAFALDPSLDVSQYAHTTWKIRDGFPKGVVISIAQTPDGYLWLGTESGLFRFDGVRGVPWSPDQDLRDDYIRSLIAARDGTLWIGTLKGLASWKDGKLTRYSEVAGEDVRRLFEDREGTIWFGAITAGSGKLCAIETGSIRCYAHEGDDYRVSSLYEDSKRNLWVGVSTGLWRWKPGPPQFYSMPPEPDGIQTMTEDDAGALLIGTRSKIRRFVGGRFEEYPQPGTARQFGAYRLLLDRDQGLWISSLQGLRHIHQGRTDLFTQSDGLSGDIAGVLFEDREGSIWVGTLNGLDRFRELAVATFTPSQGLSHAQSVSVLSATDGSVWIGTNGALNRWNNGGNTIYRQRSAHTMTGVREIVGSGFPDDGVQSLLQDGRGRIWVSTLHGVGYVENDRFSTISGVPGGNTHALAQDTSGNLWIANQDSGLLHLLQGGEVQQTPSSKLGRQDFVSAMAADSLRGGLWLGFARSGLAYFRDGAVRTSYTAADGLAHGRVHSLRLDTEDVLWVATEGGLSRLKNGHIATLTSNNGLPCDVSYWFMPDDLDSYWLNMACGLVRIARSELDAWVAVVDRDKDAKRSIQTSVFDILDGVRNRYGSAGYSPHVAKSSDGKLWFTSPDGVSVIDPRNLSLNKLPPPVHIEQIVADRKTHDVAFAASGSLRIPPLVRDLEIDYTALSLVAPEKILFRYKLEPHDRDWQNAGNRRQAFYTDLPPGNYRFRVMASNNSGVWNETGASLDFSVDPAYYQTTWFRLSMVIVFLALLAALYQLRLRQIARQFNIRIDERVAERTRIARDLHDTLLQSFQGILLKLHAVTYQLPHQPEAAQQTLEGVIEQARQAVVEGRDAVQGLRSSTAVTNDLAPAIQTLAEELASQTPSPCPGFVVVAEGAPKNLVPLLRDEVYKIASEGLRNAFRHSKAKQIETEIRYDERVFRLRIRDDGKGIDPKLIAGDGREGHFGLAGMRERAKLAGGKLAVLSEVNSGTEIELTIPASFAYAKPSAARSGEAIH